MLILRINFTDNQLPGKNSIDLSPNTVDRSTTLALHGQGSVNYGADLWSNMLQIMEHYCSNLPPRNPTEGQIWYDPINKCLQVYSSDPYGNLNWYKLYVDHPYGNGPTLKPDALTEKILSNYVNKSGDAMSGRLTLQSMELVDGKLLETDIHNQFDSVHRFYVDHKIQEEIDKLVKVTESDQKETNQYFVTIGDTFIVHGVIYAGDAVMSFLTSTSGQAYGVKYTHELVFPEKLYPQVDTNGMPMLNIQVHAELGHPNGDCDDYLRKNYSNYPVKISNKSDISVLFSVVCANLIDPDFFDQGELRPMDNLIVKDINSEIQLRSIRYTITGRLK